MWKAACFDFCWFSLLQDSPTAACRGRPSRMLRKRLDKQKLRVGEGSASPQRADYSSDTGSQNSVSIKVPSGKWWIAMGSVASYCSGFSIRYRSNLALTLEVSSPIPLDPVLSLNVIWRTQCWEQAVRIVPLWKRGRQLNIKIIQGLKFTQKVWVRPF